MDYMSHEVVRLLADMVKIESTNVGKFEGEMADFVSDWLKRETRLPVIKDEFEPGRPIVVCKLEGEIHDPAFVGIHHMDVVPPLDGWDTDPFDPVIKGNRMYGRGAADMKAGLACAMLALRDMAKLNKKPKRDIVLIASSDEEGDGMLGAMQAVKGGYVTKNSYVLDHEPNDMTINIDRKGKTWFKVTMTGIPAHGSKPWEGVDAIVGMSEVVLGIKRRIEALPKDEIFGPSSVGFGTIGGGLNTNMLAEKVTMTMDMRLAPPLTTEGSIELVDDAIKEACEKMPGLKGKSEVVAKRPSIIGDKDSIFMKSLQECVKDVTGKEAEVIMIPPYTDTAVIAGETGNLNCISYGPVADNVHKVNEYVDLDTVLKLYEISKKITYKMGYEV